MNQFDVPVLFCTFNRLECTKRVFERIREIRPAKLYLLSDGPRENVSGENEKVTAVRRYLEEHIDWKCQVFKNFADKNMGCGRRMSSGISWAFEHEEKLIIMEDDCLADLSFFRYCRELLHLYEKNEDVMLIGGYNPLGKLEEKTSYIFTPIIEIWGWATWKRAWQQYDYDISDWRERKVSACMKAVMDDKAINHYSKLFDYVYTHKIDTWDYQLQYLALQKGTFAIVPKKNMVKNIGFGAEATHTKSVPDYLYNESHEMNFPLQIPTSIKNNELYNKMVLDVYVK
ncbi:MAG: glycosyltransferase family 2 protein [Lachnospiraceae bacterium]|nr:glycosyltransferase family 2 protein [Lachnospiraceae bacterium]